MFEIHVRHHVRGKFFSHDYPARAALAMLLSLAQKARFLFF
jgi:hypothetical protein